MEGHHLFKHLTRGLGMLGLMDSSTRLWHLLKSRGQVNSTAVCMSQALEIASPEPGNCPELQDRSSENALGVWNLACSSVA